MCYNISINDYSGDFFAMSNYKFGAKGEGKGKVVYNAGIINGIVALAINEVEGVRLVSGKRRGISLFPEKDGVYADVSVRVHYGHNVPELAYRIQQSIKQNVETMTRYTVKKVDVHIQDVVFDELPVKAEPKSADAAENAAPTEERAAQN